MFSLDPKLNADTFFVTDLKVSRVLLMNNSNFPWLILVPKEQGAVELTDLEFETQSEILREINLVAKMLQKKFAPHKINIGALGNVVRQLHIHVIARFESDVCFPKPVWGETSKPYEASVAQDLISELKDLLTHASPSATQGKLLTPHSSLLTPLHKQLIYRSIHRGCKETDFLIGEFAKAKLTEISDLQLFDRFLQEDDMLLYDWILGKVEVDEDYRDIVAQIRAFHQI